MKKSVRNLVKAKKGKNNKSVLKTKKVIASDEEKRSKFSKG